MKICFLALALVFGLVVSHDCGAEPDARKAEAMLDQFMSVGRIRPPNAAQAEDALKSFRNVDRAILIKVVLGRIAMEKDHKKIGKCILVLQQLDPSPKEELLAELNRESDAGRKGNLLMTLRGFQGRDVLRTLVAELDDMRAFEHLRRVGPDSLRICDYAFDDLYLRLRAIPELQLSNGPERSDLIVNGTPVPWRDARIARLKAAVVAKFGSDLDLPDNM
jgi:hypothetical protein